MVHFSGSAWAVLNYSYRALQIVKPINFQGQAVEGEIAIEVSLLPVYEKLRHEVQSVIYYGIVNVLILTAVGFIRMMTLFVRPIENLIAKSESYSSGGESLFSPVSDGNEFAQLSLSLNRMVKRIDSDNQQLKQLVSALRLANEDLEQHKKEMIRAEKLASVGTLAAGLAHEIGNPLGIIQGYVDLLKSKDLSDAERQDFSLRAERELARISGLIRQLLDYSTSGKSKDSVIDVAKVVKEGLEFIDGQGTLKGITVSITDCKEMLMVRGVEDQLRQVILNCILNSVASIQSSTRQVSPGLTITCSRVVDENDVKTVIITIEDNGPGLSQEELSHAFDPFFTTREPGSGTGLGLYVSYMIIAAMEGTISIYNIDTGGAKVVICLPLATDM